MAILTPALLIHIAIKAVASNELPRAGILAVASYSGLLGTNSISSSLLRWPIRNKQHQVLRYCALEFLFIYYIIIICTYSIYIQVYLLFNMVYYLMNNK